MTLAPDLTKLKSPWRFLAPCLVSKIQIIQSEMYYVSTLVGLVITNSLTSTLPTITRSLSSWTVQLTEWAQILFVHLLLLKCSTFEMGHRIRPVHTSLQIFSACNRQSLCKIRKFSSFLLNALHHYKFAATSD